MADEKGISSPQKHVIYIDGEAHEVAAERGSTLSVRISANKWQLFARNAPGGVPESDEQMGLRVQRRVDEMRSALSAASQVVRARTNVILVAMQTHVKRFLVSRERHCCAGRSEHCHATDKCSSTSRCTSASTCGW